MSIIDELEKVRRLDPRGILRAESAVEFARDPRTELHNHLDWNDETAGNAYRLEQMRRLIRVNVRTMDRGDGEEIPIRAFVSLADGSGVRGYLDTRVVLEKPTKRRALIESVLDRLAASLKMHQLPEFDDIVQAIEQCRQRYVTEGSKSKARSTRVRSEARPR